MNMNSLGPNLPLFTETEYRIQELQREAKQISLRKIALQSDAQPTLFKRLTLSLTALLKTTHIETNVPISDENLGQPILKRSTATMSKV
jgi:hypothetical protein